MTMASTSRRWWGFAAVLALAALGLALAGLWESAASAGDGARASRTASVEIENFAFRPATLRIGKGSRVVFANSSSLTHTATRANGFDTGRIKPGKSASVSFARKGTFAYHCTIHPSMHGKIVVD